MQCVQCLFSSYLFQNSEIAGIHPQILALVELKQQGQEGKLMTRVTGREAPCTCGFYTQKTQKESTACETSSSMKKSNDVVCATLKPELRKHLARDSCFHRHNLISLFNFIVKRAWTFLLSPVGCVQSHQNTNLSSGHCICFYFALKSSSHSGYRDA